jgi:hypothetical protein
MLKKTSNNYFLGVQMVINGYGFRVGDKSSDRMNFIRMRTDNAGARSTDHPDINYAFRVFRGYRDHTTVSGISCDSVDINKLFNGVRTEASLSRDIGLYVHLLNVGLTSRDIAQTLGLENTLLDDLYFAGCLHDVTKLKYPDVFKDPTHRDALDKRSKYAIKNHGLEAASIALSTYRPAVARIIATADMFSGSSSISDIRSAGLEPYGRRSDGYLCAQILRAVDICVAMTESARTTEWRSYRSDPAPLDEIRAELDKLGYEDDKIYDAVNEKLCEAVA